MGEKDTRQKYQNITEALWKKARVMFQEQLVEIYKNRSKKLQGKKTDGILIDQGTPHDPALLLDDDGQLRWIQSEWGSESFERREISDMEYCILATQIIENSLRPPKKREPIRKF